MRVHLHPMGRVNPGMTPVPLRRQPLMAGQRSEADAEGEVAGLSNQNPSGRYMPKCAPGSQLYMPSSGTLRRRSLTTIGCKTPPISPIENTSSDQIFSISCQIAACSALVPALSQEL